MDARRDEIFHQTFQYSKGGIKALNKPGISGKSSFLKELNVDEALICNGAPETIFENFHSIKGLKTLKSNPSLNSLHNLAEYRFEQGDFDYIDKLIPNYMRDFAGVI